MATIVSVLNTKGGCGKTTISIHIARALKRSGKRVLLIDSDPQGSARDWAATSSGESLVSVVGLDRPTLQKDLPSIAIGYDWVIIDGAPQIQMLAVDAIKVSDIILIPVQPSPYDIWACDDLVGLIKARQELMAGKPKTAFIISRSIKNTMLARDVRKALELHELPIFISGTTQRVIYPQSSSLGSTVLDMDPNGEASQDVIRLSKELEDFVNS